VLSGSCLWTPLQLPYLTGIVFGGYDCPRYVHFICMAAMRIPVGARLQRRVAGAPEPAAHEHRSLENFPEEDNHGLCLSLLIHVDQQLLVRDATR